MGIQKVAPAALIEDDHLPDIFVTGIGKIERLTGGLVRVSYYAERRNDEGHMEHVVVLRTVRPEASIPPSMRLMSHALGNADLPFVAEGGTVRPMDS